MHVDWLDMSMSTVTGGAWMFRAGDPGWTGTFNSGLAILGLVISDFDNSVFVTSGLLISCPMIGMEVLSVPVTATGAPLMCSAPTTITDRSMDFSNL
ncbi:Uncharacterised protein [uncultured archaeon]|nr:Uncharacterised protein [uncultured archaeon]